MSTQRRQPHGGMSLWRGVCSFAALVLVLPASVMGACECGYIDELNRVWTDALVLPSFQGYLFNATADLQITSNTLPPESGIAGIATPYGILNEQSNVVVSGDELQIWVRAQPQGSNIRSGEITTKRGDIKYGTFRATMRPTSVSGTCAGFFYYGDSKNEIDIEILSVQGNDRKVNFVQHEMILLNGTTIPSPLSLQTLDVGFNPSSDFKEYRFDWTPASSDFFVDNTFVTALTANEPTKAGIVVFNHWAKGIDTWDQGPPATDTLLRIRSFRLFFNTSDSSGFNRRCANKRSAINQTLASTGNATDDSRCLLDQAILTTITSTVNSPAAVENSQGQQAEANLGKWALIIMGVVSGATLLLVFASFPIRFLKAKRREEELNDLRAERAQKSRPAGSGYWPVGWQGATDDEEMGSVDGVELVVSHKWKFSQPPNFRLPAAKQFNGAAGNGNANGGAAPYHGLMPGEAPSGLRTRSDSAQTLGAMAAGAGPGYLAVPGRANTPGTSDDEESVASTSPRRPTLPAADYLRGQGEIVAPAPVQAQMLGHRARPPPPMSQREREAMSVRAGLAAPQSGYESTTSADFTDDDDGRELVGPRGGWKSRGQGR